jgi:hypothetical protein
MQGGFKEIQNELQIFDALTFYYPKPVLYESEHSPDQGFPRSDDL